MILISKWYQIDEKVQKRRLCYEPGRKEWSKKQDSGRKMCIRDRSSGTVPKCGSSLSGRVCYWKEAHWFTSGCLKASGSSISGREWDAYSRNMWPSGGGDFFSEIQCGGYAKCYFRCCLRQRRIDVYKRQALEMETPLTKRILMTRRQTELPMKTRESRQMTRNMRMNMI